MKKKQMKKTITVIVAFLLAVVLSVLGLGGNENAVQSSSGPNSGTSSLISSTAPHTSVAPPSSAGSSTVSSMQEVTSSTQSSTPASKVETSSEAGTSSTEESRLDEAGYYYSKEDVALYLYTYKHLPQNFITKGEAQKLGWEGGSVERFAPDCAIGGDVFGNREGLLPKAKGRTYYECDIDTNGKNSRGAKRIVFSNDGLIYYTDDHYETFTLLYKEE